MPTINLPNDNTPAPMQTGFPGGDPWGSTWNPTASPSGQKRQSPQERTTMIEKVYQLVLGRNPDTRDINYYKYSTLSEEEIREQLLAGKEHKQLLEDGREYKKMKERALQAETRSKMLEGQINDQLVEFKQLTDLLKEKNQYIMQLREKINKTFNTTPFQTVNTFEEKTVDTQPSSVSSSREETFVSRVKNAVKSIL